MNSADRIVDWLQSDLGSRLLRRRAATLEGQGPRPSAKWVAYCSGDPAAGEAARTWGDRDRIVRRDLWAAGGEYWTVAADEQPETLVRLFVMCQMWGGGSGGRVMANTRRAIATPDFRDHLGEFAAAVDANPVAAVDSGGLNGWGPSFSTKLGYALTRTRAVDSGDRPALIRDRVVNRSLDRLDAAPGRYEQYLESLCDAAAELGQAPDVVEYCLFAPWLDTRRRHDFEGQAP